MSNGKKTSPWVYVGAGCGCLALAVGIAIVGGALFIGRTVKDWEASIKDPVKRAERTGEILGYQEVPNGYHPTLGLKIPLVGQFAMIADKQPNEDGDLGEDVERLFFLFRMSKLIARDKELQDVLEGRADPSEILDQANIRVDEGELLGEGKLEVQGEPVRWISHRADVFMQHGRSEGILTLVFIKCGEKGRPAVAGWLTPDDVDQAAGVAGTAADPSVLEGFLSQFALCEG